MSGLDKLIAIAEEVRTNGYGPLACRVLLARQIEEVASEIERELFDAKVGAVDAKIGCAWRNLAKYMNDLLDGKYRDYGEPGIYRRSDGKESFQEWLDKWYIPRPVDVDGEPIRFGDLFEYRGKGKLEKLPVTGFRFYSDGSIYLYIETSPNCEYTPMAEKARRANTDSIEKLRRDICNAWNGSICSPNDYECTDEECEVNEWLARAEKLFGGDSE